jgi:hypothetical protein
VGGWVGGWVGGGMCVYVCARVFCSVRGREKGPIGGKPVNRPDKWINRLKTSTMK